MRLNANDELLEAIALSVSVRTALHKAVRDDLGAIGKAIQDGAPEGTMIDLEDECQCYCTCCSCEHCDDGDEDDYEAE